VRARIIVYSSWQAAPRRTAGVVETADVNFDATGDEASS
jgi:hypothetical protein